MRTRNSAIALITALLITQMPVQRVRAQAVIGVPVVETVIIGGIVYYVWQNWQGEEQRSTTYPMLEDPEEESEPWDDPIIAASPEEARRECQYRADRDGLELDRVQEPREVKRGQNQQYRCWFK